MTIICGSPMMVSGLLSDFESEDESSLPRLLEYNCTDYSLPLSVHSTQLSSRLRSFEPFGNYYCS